MTTVSSSADGRDASGSPELIGPRGDAAADEGRCPSGSPEPMRCGPGGGEAAGAFRPSGSPEPIPGPPDGAAGASPAFAAAGPGAGAAGCTSAPFAGDGVAADAGFASAPADAGFASAPGVAGFAAPLSGVAVGRAPTELQLASTEPAGAAAAPAEDGR